MTGKKISHYELLSQIGQGGMGEVYKAQDLKLDRTVALKLLPLDKVTDERQKRRFISEAHSASILQHNNICTIHEIDETDAGQLLISMDYYEGDTLKDLIAKGPLPLEKIVDYAEQLARGLAVAHESGIIHRDVKPSNIMVTARGEVKICDFGLAKSTESKDDTKTGLTAGTAAYMSPEQVQGKKLNHLTDVWSFGVTLYEMLTGHLPFQGEYQASLFYTLINEDPEDVSEYRPDVPGYLESLCLDCLAKDPGKRPQSMQEIIRALTGEMAVKPSLSLPRILTRNRLLVSLLTIFIFVSVAYWLFVTYVLSSAPTEESYWRVAILPYKDLRAGKGNSDISEIIQTLMVNEFTGIEKVGIIDPMSLNGLMQSSLGTVIPSRDQQFYKVIDRIDITYIIDGTIMDSGDQILIQSKVQETESGEVVFTHEMNDISEKTIPSSVREISTAIVSYFQGQILKVHEDADLRPWLKERAPDMASVNALVLAKKYNLEMNFAAAEKYLRQAIDLDSMYISPRIWLISKLVYQGKMTEAKGHLSFMRSIEKNASPFEKVMIDWADAYIRNDNKHQISHLKMALEFSPGNNILLYSLGRLYYMEKDFAECINTLNVCLEMKWPASPVYYLLGDSHRQLGNLEKSKEILLQGMSIKPVYLYNYALLADVFVKEKKYDRAKEYANKFINAAEEQQLPRHSAYGFLADQNYRSRNYPAARDYFSSALKISERNPVYLYGLANTYYALDEKDSARIFYRLYLQTDSLSENAAKVRDQLKRLNP